MHGAKMQGSNWRDGAGEGAKKNKNKKIKIKTRENRKEKGDHQGIKQGQAGKRKKKQQL
jgi:hypothetical protein